MGGRRSGGKTEVGLGPQQRFLGDGPKLDAECYSFCLPCSGVAPLIYIAHILRNVFKI